MVFTGGEVVLATVSFRCTRSFDDGRMRRNRENDISFLGAVAMNGDDWRNPAEDIAAMLRASCWNVFHALASRYTETGLVLRLEELGNRSDVDYATLSPTDPEQNQGNRYMSERDKRGKKRRQTRTYNIITLARRRSRENQGGRESVENGPRVVKL